MGALESKVALITGGGRGIGRAIAERFAAEGARVAVAARTLKECEETAAAIRKIGGDAAAFECDVRDEQSILALFRALDRHFDRLDILVANAGIGVWKRIADSTTTEFDDVVNTNLRGAYLCCREAFKRMEESGGGTILTVASVAGKDAWEEVGVYSASKFGVVGLSKALFEEGKPKSIHVTCLCPGMVDTAMITKADEADRKKKLIQTADIAAAAVYAATLPATLWIPEMMLTRKDV